MAWRAGARGGTRVAYARRQGGARLAIPGAHGGFGVKARRVPVQVAWTPAYGDAVGVAQGGREVEDGVKGLDVNRKSAGVSL